MSRAVITLLTAADRAMATHWVAKAPTGTRLEFKAAKRSLDQNSRMWAMLTDIATQVVWYERKFHASDWKLIFLDALKREVRVVPNLDGDGFVNLGRSSSDLSKAEMTELIELMFAFGAKHNVVFHEPAEEAA